MARTSSYKDGLLESLRNPEEALAYLSAGLEDSPEAFLKALGNVTKAQQVKKIASAAGLQRETLYRSLSERGNPTLGTLTAVLEAIGLKLSVTPINKETKVSVARYKPVKIGKVTATVVTKTAFLQDDRFDPVEYVFLAQKQTSVDSYMDTNIQGFDLISNGGEFNAAVN